MSDNHHYLKNAMYSIKNKNEIKKQVTFNLWPASREVIIGRQFAILKGTQWHWE